MDEFAQTRGGDDLFDDDFVPIAEPVTQTFDPPQIPERNAPASRERGTRTQDSFSRQQKLQHTSGTLEAQKLVTSKATQEQDVNIAAANDSSNASHQEPPPPQPRQSTAVRGDRTATGGTPKPKLTEEELTARLAAVKLNNAKRAEAHRLAEADEASFQQREEHASQKRKEEGQAKRIMNMEREKNRLRKLGAQAGREWDEGKEEVERSVVSGSQYRRGAHGGVSYDGRRGGRGGAIGQGGDGYADGDHNQEPQQRREGYRGRGRGDRGDRGRGRGRERFNASKNAPQGAPDPVADFPALPTTSKSSQSDSLQASDTPLEPAAQGSSWADEVQAAKAPDSGW